MVPRGPRHDAAHTAVRAQGPAPFAGKRPPRRSRAVTASYS